jgi:hypothetical protein
MLPPGTAGPSLEAQRGTSTGTGRMAASSSGGKVIIMRSGIEVIVMRSGSRTHCGDRARKRRCTSKHTSSSAAPNVATSFCAGSGSTCMAVVTHA